MMNEKWFVMSCEWWDEGERDTWGLWCNQTLPQGGMWENCISFHGDENEKEVIQWRMEKVSEFCERPEPIWRNRFKLVIWEVQWNWMKMMKKWRCVLLNEVSFVRDEKRESGREVREFEEREIKWENDRSVDDKSDGDPEGLWGHQKALKEGLQESLKKGLWGGNE